MTEEQQLLAALAGTDRAQRYSAMISIGKADLKQHEKRIAGYLNETDSELRSAAIRVLAFYWRLPTYRQIAASMMQDPDDHVRAVAVMSWASYSLHSRDQDTLRSLYKILVDDNQPRRVRDAAYNSFFTVFEPTSAGLPKPALQIDKTIDECIDWKRLDAAVEESGAWRPSGPVLREVMRIGYFAEAWSIVLERATFDITLAGHTHRREIDPTTWIRTLGAMELGGFPAPSAAVDGETIALEWTRNEKTERMTVSSAPSKYRDIIRVARELANEKRASPPAVSEAAVVSTIEYRSGNPDAPHGGLTRLTLHPDERFEVLFQHRKVRRSWEGTLAAGTFDRTLAQIKAAGFPDAGPRRGLVPGEQVDGVGLERGGAWERITIYEKDARYIELVKLNSSILAPLDDTLARTPPNMLSPVVEVHPVDR